MAKLSKLGFEHFICAARCNARRPTARVQASQQVSLLRPCAFTHMGSYRGFAALKRGVGVRVQSAKLGAERFRKTAERGFQPIEFAESLITSFASEAPFR
jgi:hypothetical protein